MPPSLPFHPPPDTFIFNSMLFTGGALCSNSVPPFISINAALHFLCIISGLSQSSLSLTASSPALLALHGAPGWSSLWAVPLRSQALLPHPWTPTLQRESPSTHFCDHLNHFPFCLFPYVHECILLHICGITTGRGPCDFPCSDTCLPFSSNVKRAQKAGPAHSPWAPLFRCPWGGEPWIAAARSTS